MALYQKICVVTLLAGEDLAGKLNQLMRIDTDGRIVACNATTDLPIGTLAEDPGVGNFVDGETAVPIALLNGSGVMKGISDGSVGIGEILIAATGGQVTGVANPGAVAAGSVGIGIALTAGASAGDVFTFTPYVVAGT